MIELYCILNTIKKSLQYAIKEYQSINLIRSCIIFFKWFFVAEQKNNRKRCRRDIFLPDLNIVCIMNIEEQKCQIIQIM